MKENTIKLPSGAELLIQLAPFGDANRLNKALAKELLPLKLDKELDTSDPELLKNLVCLVLSSEDIEACVWECFKRCTYNGLKIDKNTFEPEEARCDYLIICREVIVKNCLPFVLSLLPTLRATLGEKKGA